MERQLLKKRQHRVVSRPSCKSSKASFYTDSYASSRVAGQGLAAAVKGGNSCLLNGGHVTMAMATKGS